MWLIYFKLLTEVSVSMHTAHLVRVYVLLNKTIARLPPEAVRAH